MAPQTPNSRPVHPCYLSVWEGNTGSEYSTWANITGGSLPDVVTAQGSALNVYSMEEGTGKLVLVYTFPNLAGSVCYLDVLRVTDAPDSLLVGFSGHPRLAVVSVETATTLASTSKLLLATSLLDLTPALTEQSYGSVTPLEQDLVASVLQKKNFATVSLVLGGGVVVVCVQLKHTQDGWIADEPYTLPLQQLSKSLQLEKKNPAAATAAPTKDLVQSIITGFGDIISTEFLPGYLEPTVLLLHANPLHGRAWSGRLGRQGGGTRYGLLVTAMSVTVPHRQSAVLWSVEVPADALQLHSLGNQGCLVVCANSIVAISNAGHIQQCLAVNGLVKASLTSQLLDIVQPNPWPFPRLAIQLDGAKLATVNDKTALVALRCGQIYLLQHSNAWCMLPLHQTIGAAGQVANMLCWPFEKVPKAFVKTLWDKGETKAEVEMGLVFVGSRLGDSTLLGYALEQTSVADAIQQEQALRGAKLEEDSGVKQEESGADEYDAVLRLEEDALYAPTGDDDPTRPNVIPPSDEESEEMAQIADGLSAKRKRARLSQLTVVRSLMALDSLTALGPLGTGCEGPLSRSPTIIKTATSTPSLGATAYVFPCGYGSSGGLALLTAPGRDDRSVIAEEDCINVQAIFNLPSRGFVVLSLGPDNGGTRFLQLEKADRAQIKEEEDKVADIDHTLVEVEMDRWCPPSDDDDSPRSLLANCNLLAAAELDDKHFALVVSTQFDEHTSSYSVVILTEDTGQLVIKDGSQLAVPTGISIVTMTPLIRQASGNMAFAYTLSSGDAKVVTLNSNGSIQTFDINATGSADMEEDGSSEEEQFYKDGKICAVDMFIAPRGFFLSPSKVEPRPGSEGSNGESNKNGGPNGAESLLDEDDKELYGESEGASAPSDTQPRFASADSEGVHEEILFLGVCRQSGALEVYVVSDLTVDQDAKPIWATPGCGHGVPQLRPLQNESHRAPRMHKVYTREMRFFFCGPSSPEGTSSVSRARPFCFAVVTNDGDTLLYSADVHAPSNAVPCFNRVSLKLVTRPSKEQSRHFAKLRRKGIVGENPAETATQFRRNRLHPFNNLSGQDGLFAAVARPVWFIAERGRPTMLCHRSRHVAPAGAKPRPVTGFCSGLLLNGGSGFMTLHERVGRVGSQRLTVFSGILNLSSAHGLLPGGGLFVEKVPLGVTVRRIQFIDDPNTSGGSHPLYAVLVSRETEADLSRLNDDGLAAEERQRLKDEKEGSKIKRQVEADLGGFDIEQEWVEEIEREDCFKVDTDFGGAPPIPKRVYSVWVVDAATGWNVVDSHELGEFEHATTMQVMTLTEFMAEPGSTDVENTSVEDMDTKVFITVGTGIVDKNGEDVSSKGRVILFEVKRPDERLQTATSQVAELSVVYEKDIFHGPVSSLSCLTSEGTHRLVIGAGADVNVEQWGNDKLTQVGFFRATMHVLDITLFKSFLVLSDAYDSIYFLVWRESDKSLTLLAKDYDPMTVYASGLMSRGGSLSVVCHDDRQNLQFFQYSPGDAASRGGNKLVCRADFHLGTQTAGFQSHFCRSSLLINSATPESTLAALKQQDTFFGRTDDDQRLGIHFGTTDGGYGTVIPLSEPVYWRLTALQSVMINAIESDCALSQRAWRMYRRTIRSGGCRNNDRKKGVIDGDLVIQFADLAIPDQEDLASAIGSTVDLILDNLLELRCSAMVI